MVDSQDVTIAGTVNTKVLIFSVDAPVLANVTEVETGSTVNGIYLRVEIVATSSAALPNAYLAIYKNPGNNLIGGSIPNPNAVGSSDNKKWFIHQEMLMLQKQSGSNPRTLFNGVIVIPRKMRRFAISDSLNVQILTPGVAADFCLQCHYKEFR